MQVLIHQLCEVEMKNNKYSSVGVDCTELVFRVADVTLKTLLNTISVPVGTPKSLGRLRVRLEHLSARVGFHFAQDALFPRNQPLSMPRARPSN